MCLCGPHKPKVLSAPAISRLSYLVKNIFDRAICDDHIARINTLTATTKPQWGKMNAARMLAHYSKPYATVCDPTMRSRISDRMLWSASCHGAC